MLTFIVLVILVKICVWPLAFSMLRFVPEPSIIREVESMVEHYDDDSDWLDELIENERK